MANYLIVSCVLLCLIKYAYSELEANNKLAAEMSLILDAVNDIPTVKIDADGVFKFVLLKVYKKGTEMFRHVIRGNQDSALFSDLINDFKKETKIALDVDCLGAGRMLHNTDEKLIQIYAHSAEFGKADEALMKEYLTEKYPDYRILFSDKDSILDEE